MIYHILINGKASKFNIPTSWDEVTFDKFLNIDSCGDDRVKVISLFTGVEYETLKKAKILLMDDLLEKLSFLNKQPEPVIPKTILGFKVPADLEFEQVQMYLDLKTYVREAQSKTPMEQLESYALYCAVYACIQKHGKYDFKLAESMKEEFMHAPATEVLGIGNFTLVRLIGLNLATKVNYPKAGSRTTRSRLALTAFRLRLERTLQSLISSVQPRGKSQKSLNGN